MTYYAFMLPITQATELESIINVERAMLHVIVSGELVIGSTFAILLHKSRSGYKRTDSVINRLILYNVASGLINVVNAGLSLIVSLVYPNIPYYVLFDGIGPKRTSAPIARSICPAYILLFQFM